MHVIYKIVIKQVTIVKFVPDPISEQIFLHRHGDHEECRGILPEC